MTTALRGRWRTRDVVTGGTTHRAAMAANVVPVDDPVLRHHFSHSHKPWIGLSQSSLPNRVQCVYQATPVAPDAGRVESRSLSAAPRAPPVRSPRGRGRSVRPATFRR